MLVWLQALILEATCSIHITTCKTLPMAARALQELASLVDMYPVMLHGLAAHIRLLAGAQRCVQVDHSLRSGSAGCGTACRMLHRRDCAWLRPSWILTLLSAPMLCCDNLSEWHCHAELKILLFSPFLGSQSVIWRRMFSAGISQHHLPENKDIVRLPDPKKDATSVQVQEMHASSGSKQKAHGPAQVPQKQMQAPLADPRHCAGHYCIAAGHPGTAIRHFQQILNPKSGCPVSLSTLRLAALLLAAGQLLTPELGVPVATETMKHYKVWEEDSLARPLTHVQRWEAWPCSLGRHHLRSTGEPGEPSG